LIGEGYGLLFHEQLLCCYRDNITYASDLSSIIYLYFLSTSMGNGLTEYQKGKGFESDDQEMEAWYAQLGYELYTEFAAIPAIQPYAAYESWDKDLDHELVYRYLETGISLKTSPYSLIRLAYKSHIDKPDSADQEPDMYLLRLQFTM